MAVGVVVRFSTRVQREGVGQSCACNALLQLHSIFCRCIIRHVALGNTIGNYLTIFKLGQSLITDTIRIRSRVLIDRRGGRIFYPSPFSTFTNSLLQSEILSCILAGAGPHVVARVVRTPLEVTLPILGESEAVVGGGTGVGQLVADAVRPELGDGFVIVGNVVHRALIGLLLAVHKLGQSGNLQSVTSGIPNSLCTLRKLTGIHSSDSSVSFPNGQDHTIIAPQVHGHSVGPLTGGVIVVIPGQGNLVVHRAGVVGVGQSDGTAADKIGGLTIAGLHTISKSGQLIFSDRVFRDVVGDLLSPLLLRQTGDGGRPVFSGNHEVLHLDIAAAFRLVQAAGDAVGPDAVLVVVVLPGLVDGNIHSGRGVGVGDESISRDIVVVANAVTVGYFLAHAISHSLTIHSLGQVCPGITPVVIRRYCCFQTGQA